MTHLDYLRIARGIGLRRKRLALLAFAVATVIVLPAAHYLSKHPTTTFKSTTTILLFEGAEGSQPQLGARPFAVQLAILQSRSLAERVLDALPPPALRELGEPPAGAWAWILAALAAPTKMFSPSAVTESSRERELQQLRSRTRFVSQGEGLVVIETRGASRENAMSLARTYVDVLVSRTRALTADDARLTREFLERQVSDLAKTLRASEARLQAFITESGSAKITERSQATVQQLSEAETRLGEAEVNRKMAEARLDNLRRRVPAGPASAVEASALAGSSAAVAAMRRHLAHLETSVEEVRTKHGDNSPQLGFLYERIAERRRALAEMTTPVTPPTAPTAGLGVGGELSESVQDLEVTIRTLKAQEEGLRRRATAVRGTLTGLSATELKYATLARDVEAAQRLYSILFEKLTAARIREEGATAAIKVIEPPTAAVPVADLLRMGILALAATLVVAAAVGVPALAEFRTPRIDTPADLQRLIGTPPLALIPDLRGDGYKFEKEFIMAEGFRTLRVEVEMMRRRRHVRSLLVTSALPQEGKSTAVVNLARAFREAGASVIIADGDLLRPTLHRKLGIAPTASVAEVMSGTRSLDTVLADTGTGIRAIAPRPARSPASRGLMARHRLQPLVAALTAKADIVIFDSAPILTIRETALLASVVDSVILIVTAGSTSWEDTARTKALLDETGANILGTVLNQIPVSSLWRQYRHYYEPYWIADATPETAPLASPRRPAPLDRA